MPDDKIDILKNAIRDIPDFPQKGIIFKDITTILKDSGLYADAVDVMSEAISGNSFDTIVAIEARGFIFGAAMAYKLKKNFVPIRKPGKLPAETVSEEYQLEYGTDRVEMHRDAVREGMNVVLVDDLLATGGTALAAAKLIEKLGGNIVTVLFLVELAFLNGRELLKNYNVNSLIVYK